MKTTLVTMVAMLILQTLVPVANFPLHHSCISNSIARGVIRQSFVSTTQIFAKGSDGGVGSGKAGKGSKVTGKGKTGKSQSNTTGGGNVVGKGKAGKGQGNAGGWPSTSGNPSGSGRSNAATKSDKAPKSLWEQVRHLEEKARKQKESLKKIQRLEQEKNKLVKERDGRPNVAILFHGQYNFGPKNVVQLSQLISMYLEEKPSTIDRDRIYSCVKNCFEAAYHKHYPWEENPDYYGHNLRMLLATCLASNWFTNNQWENVVEWNNWVCRYSYDEYA